MPYGFVVVTVCFAASVAGSQAANGYRQREYSLRTTIGGAADSALIGRVSSVQLANGLVYVLDGLDFNVKVFDASGSLLRTFGRRGGGPGELSRPIGLDVSDTILVVSDQVNGRVVFATSGRHIETDKSASFRRSGQHKLRHGLSLVVEGGPRRADPRLPPEQEGAPPDVITIVHPSGRRDTLATIESDFVFVESALGRGALRESGFGRSGAYSLIGDSLLVVADGYAGTVRWYRFAPSGAVLARTADLRRQGKSVTRSDVAQQEKVLAGSSGYRTGRGDAAAPLPPRAARIKSQTPARWSEATTILVAEDLTVWVGAPRTLTVREGREATITVNNNVWTVFPENEEPYVVTLPSDTQLRGVSSRFILTLPAIQGAATVMLRAPVAGGVR